MRAEELTGGISEILPENVELWIVGYKGDDTLLKVIPSDQKNTGPGSTYYIP